jgi:hypothetical protein
MCSCFRNNITIATLSNITNIGFNHDITWKTIKCLLDVARQKAIKWFVGKQTTVL